VQETYFALNTAASLRACFGVRTGPQHSSGFGHQTLLTLHHRYGSMKYKKTVMIIIMETNWAHSMGP